MSRQHYGAGRGVPLKLERIVLREVAMRLKEPFITPLGAVEERRFVVVEAHCAGHAGYGEVTVLSAPIYNEETPVTAWHALADFLIPLVGELSRHTPEQVARAMEPVRRHRMAKAGLEAAVWDVYARLEGRSLASLWGGVHDRVEAGIAVGLQPHIDGLVVAVDRCVDAGYRRVKVKIKPGWDEEPLRALREAFGDRILLMADAQRRLHPGRRGPPAAPGRARAPDDRAAPGPRRHRRSRPTAAAAGDAHLPRREHRDPR